ncbi:hypothetical protein [Flavobacterium sp. LC2016-01]|uniref:hypothetical protein n=1 Tax=Flavobacterium sp. LC2016-01 TaxID=2675876 RepID=UPI0012BAF882|nr:hypothetical protein [Flavobacterium sp. LC2016-01]MTH14140.1 hypothetical protein [Flavobacterium sp. LC2016-01]
MKKIIGIILGVIIIVFAYNYISNFLCECEVKCKNCPKTSKNSEFSKKSGFYIGTYTPSFDTIKLKNYNEKIIIKNVWVEKTWFKNTDNCTSPKLEKTEGYNVILEFSKTNKNFIFNLRPITTDKFGKYSNGIKENKKEMRFVNLPSKIQIIVQERSPDKNVGWTKITVSDTLVLNLSSKKKALKRQIENRKFFVGDVDNDEVSDTAFVSYKWNNETNEIECGEKICHATIKFKKNIPTISMEQRLAGLTVMKTEDVNQDNANEILIFSRTNEGWWNTISVWSFQKGTWNEIAKTNAFISDDKDFENRIIKEKGKYYLIGQDKWNEDENGDFKEVKVKL